MSAQHHPSLASRGVPDPLDSNFLLNFNYFFLSLMHVEEIVSLVNACVNNISSYQCMCKRFLSLVNVIG